jgi:hypothetical protein
VSAITYDKRALCRNQPTPSTEVDYTVQDIAEWCQAKGEAMMAGRGEKSRD